MSAATGEAERLAWTEQVRRVYGDLADRLWRAVLAWSGSADVADEAVAEAFAQLVRRGPVVRDPAAWVWQASVRLAAGELQRRRQDAARAISSQQFDTDVAGLPGRIERLPDEALDLLRAMAMLSEQQRRCVALVDVAGHTAPSAAAILNTSAATVRVQLMRARRRLRSLLDDDRELAPDRGPAHPTPTSPAQTPELER